MANYSAPPPMAIDTNKSYTATFDTSRGRIVCELYPKDAPATVNNSVFLAREGLYDGTKFPSCHRGLHDSGRRSRRYGSWRSWLQIEAEVKENPRKHQVGSLSMANAGPKYQRQSILHYSYRHRLAKRKARLSSGRLRQVRMS